MPYNIGGLLRPTLQTSSGYPQAQPQPTSINGGTGPLLGPANSSGTPNQIGPLQSTQPAMGSNLGTTSHHRPPPGQTHVSQFQFDKVLQDSNPVRYPRPMGSTTAQPANGQQWTPFPQVSSGGQPQQGSGGSVLGSSTSQPPFYGGGLAPASGLGGGLWPSLVSLYQ